MLDMKSQSAGEIFTESTESLLSRSDAEIEHLDAVIDLLLLNLEDRYCQLLGDLRGKEQQVREALHEVESAGPGSCCTLAIDNANTAPANNRQESVWRLRRATEDLRRALESADSQVSRINSEVTAQYVACPPVLSSFCSAQAVGVAAQR